MTIDEAVNGLLEKYIPKASEGDRQQLKEAIQQALVKCNVAVSAVQ